MKRQIRIPVLIFLAFPFFLGAQEVPRDQKTEEKPRAEIPAANQHPGSLDLQTAEKIGVTESLALRIAKAELEISQSTIDLAESSLYPSFEAGASYQYMDPPAAGKVELIPGFKKTLTMGYQHNFDLGLQAKAVLYAGGKRWEAIDAAKLGEQAQRYLYTEALRGASFTIRSAYFQAKLSEEGAALAEKAYERSKDRRVEAEQSFKAGAISKLELLRAKTGESDFLIQRDESRDTARSSRDSLASFLNVTPDSMGTLSDSLETWEKKVRGLDPAALRQEEPGFTRIEAARTAARAMEQKAKMAESDYYPTVVAGLKYDIMQPFHMENKVGDQFAAVIQATVPIYDWGKTSSNVEMARKEASKASLQAEDAYRKLMVHYREVMNRLESLQQSLDSRKTGIDQAKQTLEATTVARKNGAATHSDVSDAELLLLRMELAQLRTITEFLIQLAHFEQLTGIRTGVFPESPFLEQESILNPENGETKP